MKKKLVYLLLFTLLVACRDDEEVTPENKDEVTPKNITAVGTLADLVVAFGTGFGDLGLPDQIQVTYSDNTTDLIGISFSPASYNSQEAGKHVLKGDLILPDSTTNIQGLNGTVTVVVATLKLKTISQDGSMRFEYIYDTSDRLDYFKAFDANTEYHYTYSADNKVTERLRKHAGNNYSEKYHYHTDGSLDQVEFYNAEALLINTRSYTYENERISRYDNSDERTPTLKYRTFLYESQHAISKISFDTGNSWNFTYDGDRKMAMPLVLDLADPQNQAAYPVKTFTFVELSSYTAEYTYNAWDYPVQETRTYPGDGNRQSVIIYTYE